MAGRTSLVLVLLPALLLWLPGVSGAAGSQTIRYAEDQAFVNMDGAFIAGDSGFGCYSLGYEELVEGDPAFVEETRVGGCHYYFELARAATGSTAVLDVNDENFLARIEVAWALTDDDGHVCDAGTASGYGGAIGSFVVRPGCRTVWFDLSDTATLGTVTLSWSA